MSTNEDYFFPVTADGRGSSVDVFPGGQNLGEVTDLRYFTNKMFRGLRIPSSYLPTGTEDSERTYSDGKTTTALIQEWRFNQYCKRLQSLIVEKLDTEFKMFMRWRGVNIDGAVFDLRFNEPQNFAKYRQAEVDATRINAFQALEATPYLSKRFLLKRYLDLSEEEMQENEELWNQENSNVDDTDVPDAGLRNVGVTTAGIQSDLDNLTPEIDDLGGDPGPAQVGDTAGAGPDGGAVV